MSFVAWSRRGDEDDPWDLKMLFELNSQGKLVLDTRVNPNPHVLIINFWDLANRMSATSPELSKLEEVDPIDLPLLELQVNLSHENEMREFRLEKPGTYFPVDASGEDTEPVAYGRIIRILKPGQLAEAVVLGIRPDRRTLWQTLRPIQDPMGKPVKMSEDLVPGAHYLIHIGEKSMVHDMGKKEVLELREDRVNWVHVVDDELDAPDLPPSGFRRR